MDSNTKYKLIDKIAAGNFGQVWKAQRKTDGKMFAQKIIKLPNDENMAKTLNESMTEVLLLKGLKHEHIIEFEEVFFTGINQKSMQMNIVTELAEGGNLYDENFLERLGYD